ncbi:sensor histidine kinase [Dactylosporangium sp. CA-233914]|uniref:sensor histidine kinase n=1 Tax=Dactylosporangium sp. CA-233914 TaxID=3239934 RepID=UPI003D8D3DF9
MAFAALFGVVLIALVGPLLAVPLGRLERWRLQLIDERPLPSTDRVSGRSAAGWVRARYTQRATWRAVAYSLILATAGPLVLGCLTLVVLVIVAAISSPFVASGGDGTAVLGPILLRGPRESIPYAVGAVALLPAMAYLLGLLAGGHGQLVRALLGGAPVERLQARLVEVTRSRARLVDAFEAERRRIERDLHDGAQQRLIGLTLRLGLAKLDMPAGSAAAEAVSAAHKEAKLLMGELRELIHGIHPQVLTDLGLPAALRRLADRSPVPVTVETRLSRRPPAHVEAAAYFVASEALTNVARHSGARSAGIQLHEDGAALSMRISDDGRGGADPARGTGLLGLADRVAVGDGRMFLSSPPGGPTIVQVELPYQPAPA